MRRFHFSRGMLAACLALTALLGSLLSRSEPEESSPAFAALPAQTKTELLAGALALLTEPEDGYTVRLAVAGVLLNRLDAEIYGDTVWQVTAPLLDPTVSEIPQTGDSTALRAAQDAMRGHNPLPNALSCGTKDPPEGAILLGRWWFL